MTSFEWLDKYCYIKQSDIGGDEGMIYCTKVGNYYVTRSGMENHAQQYANLDIEPIDISNLHKGRVFCVGKSNVDGKYYGWSHRAISGFAVGSRIKIDNPAYKACNLGELIKITNDFWSEPEYEYTNSCIVPFNHHPDYNEEFKAQLSKDGFRTDYTIMTTWLYNDKVPNEKIRNTISGTFTFVPQKFVGSRKYAKTQRHALQMAIDFAEGVC